MKINCQFHWTDYLEAILLHRQPDQFGKIINIIFWLLAVIYLFFNLLVLSSGHFYFSLWLPILAMLVIMPLTRYVLYPYQARHLFGQQKEFSTPVEFEITETNLISTTQFGTHDRPLLNFVNWKENEKLFVLYHTDLSFIMLPKRCFNSPEQIESFRSRLSMHIIVSYGKMQRVFSIISLVIVFIFMIYIFIVYSI